VNDELLRTLKTELHFIHHSEFRLRLMMINGIIGRKIGMTQIFAADGMVTPVTVIKAVHAWWCRRKTSARRDGYNAVQVDWLMSGRRN
jgi:hypothetical protein